LNWTSITKIAASLFNSYVKKYVVSVALRAIGVTGGIWASIVSFVLTKVFFFVKKEVESEARLLDQQKKDKENLAEYKKDIQENAPESKLIEDETNILNGGRKP
jgi:flagellar biosynthesis component FlhA